MPGRFFQSFKKSVKGLGRQHVHLVDDVNAVLAHLWRDAHLIDKEADIVHRVIARRIQFVNIEGLVLVKGFAGRTLVTGLIIGPDILAINGFGKNSCTSGFTYPAWTAK